jgi:hypothetical protein
MRATETALVILLGAAALLCLWAWRTGGPGQDPNLIRRAAPPRHSAVNRGETTTRLRPPFPDAIRPMDRDGGMAQRLPRREDLPWNQ